METAKKRVLVLGAGGREHALVKACLESEQVAEVMAAPGNGGMEKEVRCFNIDAADAVAVLGVVQAEKIDFVIVGPEAPLCAGVADKLRAAGIAVYGPNEDGAFFEASKAYTKDFFNKYAIPTGASETFTELEPAVAYLEKQSFPVVIKASGLAAGKGVVIVQDFQEGADLLDNMLSGAAFGESGKTVLIEEFLSGPEASIMLMVSGTDYILLPFSQDHKKIGEGDTGLNTGGMGAYAPANVVDEAMREQLIRDVIEPSLQGIAKEGIDYRGTLYIGVMLTEKGPKVLEYNVRFGDPETQVLLPLFESDAVEAMYACATGSLSEYQAEFTDDYTMVVVMSAGGYPDSYRKGDEITLGVDNENAWIVHAGTVATESGAIVTSGGRVLGIVGKGSTLQEARNHAYQLVEQTDFADVYYRKDIGHQAL